MTAGKAVPEPTPETRPFWEACEREELLIQYCASCQAHFFYPRPACPRCGHTEDVSWVRASGNASLHSYVINHVPAPGFESESPYVIAVVELEEGPRMLSNIVGVEPRPELLEIEMALRVTFEERDGTALPVFRPAGAGGEA